MSDNRSNESEHRCSAASSWKVMLTAILLSAATTFFVGVLLIQCLSSPTFLKYTNLADAVVLNYPDKVQDPHTLYTIGQLVTNGTLMSLDDLWSFQSSFYQTIITFLIAINGIIGALAFVFIKSSSNDKAQEAAIAHSKTYIASADFKERVGNAVDDRISGVQYDFQNATDELWKAKQMIEEKNDEIERLAREQQELRRHVSIISKTLATFDRDEEQGGDLEIGDKD